jgi:hypothetical protein
MFVCPHVLIRKRLDTFWSGLGSILWILLKIVDLLYIMNPQKHNKTWFTDILKNTYAVQIKRIWNKICRT